MINLPELNTWLESKGFPAYRAGQVYEAVHKNFVGSFQEITSLPKDLRDLLEQEVPFCSIELLAKVPSRDGSTIKFLFKLADGENIETVLLAHAGGGRTICLSSQVGCAVGCTFCATGESGFDRNLTVAEIVDQVLFLDRDIQPENDRIVNVVFMGMGEPMLNYDNVMQAIRLMNDAKGIGIGARHITVSTSGIIPGIQRFTKEPMQLGLAISLHAPNQILRNEIMPIASPFPLDRLMESIRAYQEATNRRVTYEYLLMEGVNDSREIAKALSVLLKDQNCHVNLIPYHAAAGNYKPSQREQILDFQKVLVEAGIPTNVRKSEGLDIAAACGQLRRQHLIQIDS